eukprot:6829525-Pyramimonas_sp.AAC.1
MAFRLAGAFAAALPATPITGPVPTLHEERTARVLQTTDHLRPGLERFLRFGPLRRPLVVAPGGLAQA